MVRIIKCVKYKIESDISISMTIYLSALLLLDVKYLQIDLAELEEKLIIENEKCRIFESHVPFLFIFVYRFATADAFFFE